MPSHAAAPVFFICTPDLENNYYFWDILSHLLIEHKEISDEDIKLIKDLCRIENLKYTAEINLDDDTFEKGLQWKMLDKWFPSVRCKILASLVSKAEYMLENSSRKILEILYSKNFSIDIERSFNPNLNNLDLYYCTIGAHTMNHYCLSSLNQEEQVYQIKENKRILEQNLGSEIKYFAYPFGTKSHYNSHSVDLVKNNFSLGFSNFAGLINRDSNPYELPRFLVRDWELDEFKNNINSFFKHK